ncbi:MAG: sigma factor-like helix-turn-helix DNA-binding protein [Candidatus Izemoplasmatales bacterium]
MKKIKFRIGVKHSIFNSELRKRRIKKGLSQEGLADILNIGVGTISSYETFKKWPTEVNAKRLSDYFQVDIQTIFPEWLKEFKLSRSSYTTESIITENILPAMVEKLSIGTGYMEENMEQEIDQEFLESTINNVLKNLTEKERSVIENTFGLNGHQKKTLGEVARMYNVTRERIRQIRNRAVRRLKHPVSREKLISFT